ncbi:MAG: prolipoprotein diacylglyceryl transferase [Alphaproteobacteria bacterium]
MLPVLAFPAIDPVAVQFGPLAVRWYALAYVGGLLLGWWYMRRLAARAPGGITADHIGDFVVWATLGIILGGRLGFVLFYRLDYYLANPADLLAVWKGGMSFHGGLLGMAAAAWLFSRRRGIPLLTLGDLTACAAPIGLFFGRLANFINGELFGRVSDVPWAMVFPAGGPLPRHPSQLYEATLEGALLFVLLLALARGTAALTRPGLCFGVFLTGYGLARILVELFREPDAYLGFILAGISMGQILSVPLVVAGLWLIRRAERTP